MSSALTVDLAGIKMRTPLMAASGTFGFAEEFADFVDFQEVGAVVVKGLTREPRRGNAGRRIAETPAGMLNCIGLQNPGVETFLQEILPRIKQYEVPIIVNINGNVVEDYAALAEALDKSGVAGIEVNISCPQYKTWMHGIRGCAGNCRRRYRSCQGQNQPACNRKTFSQCHGYHIDCQGCRSSRSGCGIPDQHTRRHGN